MSALLHKRQEQRWGGTFLRTRHQVLAIAAVVLVILGALTRPAWEPPLYRRSPDGAVLALAALLRDHGPLQLEAGFRMHASGRLEEAKQRFQLAATLMPDSPEANSWWAQAAADLGHFEEAARAFRSAAQVPGGGPDLELLEARYLLETQRPAEAHQRLLSLTRRQPELAHAWYTLGLSYSAVHNTREAAEAFDRARRANPRHFLYYREAARILHQAGALNRAEATARQALARAPGEAQTRLVLADILLDRGPTGERVSEVRQLLSVALRSERARPLALCALGRVALHEGQYTEARRHLAEACRLAPENLVARYHLAQALQHLRDPGHSAALAQFHRLETEERTERYLRGAVKEEVAGFGPRERLASFYAGSGRVQEAAAVVEDYLARVPEDGRARRLLHRLRAGLGSSR